MIVVILGAGDSNDSLKGKREVKKKARKIPVRSRNINDVSGLYSLQQSLVIGSYVKMMVCRVLSDRYRIIQEQFQYQGVEI